MKLIFYPLMLLTMLGFTACSGSKKALTAQNQMMQQMMMMQNQQQANQTQQSSNTYGDYSRADELNDKLKSLTKEGWEVDGSSRTLRGLLVGHYSKVDASPSLTEVPGVAQNCKLLVVARSSAINIACMNYANSMSQEVVGKALRDLGKDDSSAEAKEFDRFRQACSTKFAHAIKGDLVESYSFKRVLKNGTIDYQVMFLVDKEDVQNRLNDAIKAAIEETKLRNEEAKLVMDFINE